MMRRLLVGSQALRALLGDTIRTPKDTDLFSDNEIPGCEVFWHPAMEGWLPEGTDRAATRDELYTIKVSHSYWELKNGSWLKHIEDVATLRQHGAKLIPELHKMLYQVWVEQHGKKQVDLDQDSAEFFADAVKRRYDHDSIHASVAYGGRPLYEAILKDGQSVAVDMSKLKALTFEDKVKLFREEIYATALERMVIPSDYKTSPRRAYAWALRRTITSLTKGWSAKFLVENYAVFRNPDCDYVARHKANSDKLILLEA